VEGTNIPAAWEKDPAKTPGPFWEKKVGEWEKIRQNTVRSNGKREGRPYLPR